MRLILFDIDGTLISDAGASRDAFFDALVEVFDYSGDLDQYDFSGRTDPQIAEMVLGDAGIQPADIAAHAERLWQRYVDGLSRNAGNGQIRALPGVQELLAVLAEDDDLLLGLLTGNIEPGARLKLAPPGLNEYFPFGAFGSDSPVRSDLPPVAVMRATASTGHRFEPSDVVIIGDSIHDVRCGVPHDATTIAIASGRTPADVLRAENPRHFFESAEDLEGLLQAIRG
jgi:phosphoglycolate phosphatase-like HAD superfamily hydrolase